MINHQLTKKRIMLKATIFAAFIVISTLAIAFLILHLNDKF